MSAHLGGQKHQKALAAATPSDIWRAAAVATAAARRPQAAAGARAGRFSCELCGVMCNSQNDLNTHLRSNRHALQQFGLLMRQGHMLTANTHNVHVSQLPEPLPPVAPGEAVAYTLTATNLGATAVSLRHVGLLQPMEGVTLHDSEGVAAASAGVGGRGTEVVLERGEAHSVTVLLAPTFMGLIRGVVLFDFGAFQVRVQHARCFAWWHAVAPSALQDCACKCNYESSVHSLLVKWRKVLRRQMTRARQGLNGRKHRGRQGPFKLKWMDYSWLLSMVCTAMQVVRAISGSCATPEAAAEAEAAAAAAAAANPKRFRRRLEPVNTDIVPGGCNGQGLPFAASASRFTNCDAFSERFSPNKRLSRG